MNTELVVDSLAKGKTNSESLQDLEKREKTEGKRGRRAHSAKKV